MHAFFEHVGTTPESSWNYRIRREPEFEFGWHYHPEFELTLITEGSGSRFVGDSIEEYRAGDLTFAGPELPHAYASARSSPLNEARIIQFRRDFLGAELFERPEFRAIGQLMDRAARGLSFPLSASQAAEPAIRGLADLRGARRTLHLLDLLGGLAQTPAVRPLASVGYWPTMRAGAERRLEKVLQYLHARHDRPLRLDEIADVAHMTPAAFSRFFRRATGRTLTAYLAELRISSACRLLVDSDLTIAEIAASCGFVNLSNFNRRFRTLKAMSPRSYRAHFRAA